MTYTKKDFGLELKKKLAITDDCDDVSDWAFQIYIERGLEFEKDLDRFVLKLVAMQEGPEFILSSEELIEFANKLINSTE